MATTSRFFAQSCCPRLLKSRRLWTFLMLLLLSYVAVPQALEAGTPYGILVNQIDHTTSRSTIAAYMDQAAQGGATWVRCDFFWYSVEWNQGQWDWHYFDYVTQEAAARGLQVIPILWGTPSWAGTFSYGVPNMAAWETFVDATVRRYRSIVKQWEIWNEPDLPFYWRGTPAQYAELLWRANATIKAADPTAIMWLGGLAQGGGANLNFLQQILGDVSHPAGPNFDVHNIHTNFRPMSGIVSQIQSNVATLTSFGLTKPLVATEASYTSDPAYQTLAGYTDGEAGQARYLTDAYSTMLQNGITVAVWAALQDYLTAGAYQSSGLLRTDWTPKLADTAYQQLWQAGTSSPSPPPPLTISNVSTKTTPTTATVQWTTNLPADSRVEDWGADATVTLAVDGTLTTSHTVKITNLLRRTTYSGFITSQAADGSTATTAVFSFQTK